MSSTKNRRILLVDDNASIHEDFKKILGEAVEADDAMKDAKAAFFGSETTDSVKGEQFEIDSAYQGKEGFEKVKQSIADNNPYSVAFVDVRMPPGWDGIETIGRIWEVDSELQVVVCTAFSDYSWEQMIDKLGDSDRLLILKKPFDPIEIRQLASALSAKWTDAKQVKDLIDDLRTAEQRSRSYASSLQTVNSALETAKAAADKSSELKTEFLVHLSNEIHKNLDSILSRVGLLRTTDSEPHGQIEHLEVILGASNHLITSLDQILDITMMESGQLTVEMGACSPVEVIEGVVESFKERAEEKGLSLSFTCNGPIPESIQTDRDRFAQILTNLLDNAVRFTETGGVEVVLGTEQTGDWKRPRLRCEVVDTGVGIPIDRQGTLFEPFVRLDESSEEYPSGSGLGLTLVKRLARLLNADIAIESHPGSGSRFALTMETGDLSGVKMISG